ncbi:hypothetical protein DBY66_014105 [Pantoea sp. RIT413]|uniref:pentapeptide repeat-containing protein n=1 Tax=Pantoea sp. RIT413 TaxID=2202162 RepID=UPI000D38D0AB|nr:pentapeptide repeat-containing protein [Pantoea sp. RIT 413]RAU29932.1 hypothetical protein DBY66_014105 [Pantoea sp. RIT 413]
MPRGNSLSKKPLKDGHINFDKSKLNSANLIRKNLAGCSFNKAWFKDAKMTGINLERSWLKGAHLKRANLENANMERALLEKAYLKHAILNNANLKRARFSEAVMNNISLQYADLQHADLSDADLRGADLRNADLRNAILINADLTGADLRGAILTNADLSCARLTGANLSEIEFNGVLLGGTNFSKAILRKTDFRKAHLGTIIYYRYLQSGMINFSEANLQEADFSGQNLRLVNLDKADCSYAKLRGAGLCNTILTDAILTGADLQDTNLNSGYLRGSRLTGAILTNTSLSIEKIIGGSLSNICLNGACIALSQDGISWDDSRLDLLLNHHNNASGSLLTTLHSIDDRHNQLKTDLALQLMRSLTDAGYGPERLTSVALPVLEILGQPPYTDDSALVAWLASVAEARIAARGTEEMTPTIAGGLLFPFERELCLAVRQSAALIQLVHAALDSGDPALAGRAEALYARYLALPEVAPYTRSAPFDRLNPDVPDEPARVSLAERDEINLVLLPATPGGPVMLLSRDALDGMLHPDPAQPAWDHFCLMETPEHARPVAAINPEILFRQDFPLFLSSYLTEQNKKAFVRLLDTLDLKAYRADFDAALRSRSSGQKLISAKAQTDLNALFSHALRPDESWGRLTAEHAARVLRAFTLEGASRREQAQHFLCLSALFARLSSSLYFGTEDDSPVTLRVYAHALMLEAAELDSDVFKAGQLGDWQNRFQKRGDAFECTAVLSDIMTSHARHTCPAVLAGIRPAAWT